MLQEDKAVFGSSYCAQFIGIVATNCIIQVAITVQGSICL